MRFDAATYDDVIGAKSVFVEMNWKAFGGGTDDNGLHAGTDRASTEFFRDAITLNDLPLPGGGSTSMAPHGGNNERLRAQPLAMTDNGLDDQMDVRNPAATRRDGYTLPRTNGATQFQATQLFLNDSWYVFDSRAFK
jgi:hypothetical protein